MPQQVLREIGERPGAIVDADARRFRVALERLEQRPRWPVTLLRSVIRAAFRLVSWRMDVTWWTAPDPSAGFGAGRILVVAPHRAWIEPFLLLAAWPGHAAPLVWLADGHTVSRSMWRRRILSWLGVIPVRGSLAGPRHYAEMAQRALTAGAALVIFPETGPASTPDSTRRISPGFAYIARYLGAPVVPVVIGGSHRIVRGSRFSLDFLPPIDPGSADVQAFSGGARSSAHELAASYATVVATLLPARTAEADAARPHSDRWRWLTTLLD